MKDDLNELIEYLETISLVLGRDSWDEDKKLRKIKKLHALIKNLVTKLNHDEKYSGLNVLTVAIAQNDFNLIGRASQSMLAYFIKIRGVMEKEQTQESKIFVKKCPNCRHIARGTANYCSKCGTIIMEVKLIPLKDAA